MGLVWALNPHFATAACATVGRRGFAECVPAASPGSVAAGAGTGGDGAPAATPAAAAATAQAPATETTAVGKGA